MSLYNLVSGVNPCTFFVLPMLGKHPDLYPRFRDCFVKDDERPKYDKHIFVYTRVGGGNRDSYEDEITELRHMPGYVTDYDDLFDSTYATFIFEVPEELKADYELILAGKIKEISDSYKQKLYDVFPKLKEQFDHIFKSD